MSRHRFRIALALFTLIIFSGTASAQRATTPATPDPAKPQIRAITAFVNLDRNKYQQQIADAMKTLRSEERRVGKECSS